MESHQISLYCSCQWLSVVDKARYCVIDSSVKWDVSNREIVRDRRDDKHERREMVESKFYYLQHGFHREGKLSEAYDVV